MSYIPTSAMPHAKAHHDDAPESEPTAKHGAIETRLRSAVDTVKAHPRTGLAIGATLILGAVAAVVLPVARAEAPKPAPKRKRAPAKRAPAKPKKAA